MKTCTYSQNRAFKCQTEKIQIR